MPVPTNRPLSIQEQKDLLAILEELRSRGIALPSEVKDVVADKKKKKWPLAPNGYFIRDDGFLYNPSPVHEAFIKSTARNSMLYGPKGS